VVPAPAGEAQAEKVSAVGLSPTLVRGHKHDIRGMTGMWRVKGRCDRSPPRREAHRGSSRTVFREGDIRCGPGDPSRTGT